MLIREIQKKDNSCIASAIRQVFILDNFPKTGTAFEDEQLDFMFENYQKEDAIYFVIEDNGKVIGGAGISRLEQSSVTVCELQKMYFLDEARGKGLGFKIVLKCLEKAKEFGFEKCYLETLPQMLIAQHIYRKVGFEYLCHPLGNTGHSSCPVWMLFDLNAN